MKTPLIPALLIMTIAIPMAMTGEDPKKDTKVIDWGSELINSYTEAINQKKPMVMVMAHPIGHKGCVNCKLIIRELLSDELLPLADRAVFVMTHRDKDEVSQKLYEKLKIESYPTISVIAPNPDKVEELGRLVGHFTAAELRTELERIIGKNDKPAGPGFFEKSGAGSKVSGG